MNKLFVFFILSVVNFLAVNEIHSAEKEAENGKSENQVVKTPNPTNLEPKWYSYFDVENEALDERIEKVRHLLEEYYSLLPISEEATEAKTQVSRFFSYLDSLQAIKKQKVEMPLMAWLPKESYSLSDYIKLSDKIYQLSMAVKSKRIELNQYSFSADGYYQALHNTFAEYLAMDEHSKEKYLKGLLVMELGAKLLYQQAEVELAKDLIAIDEEVLKQYRVELEQVEKNLQLQPDIEQLEIDRKQVQSDLEKIQNERLELELQTVKEAVEEQKGIDVRLANQKLVNYSIKEAYFKAELVFTKAKLLLFSVLKDSQNIDYEQRAESIKKFFRTMKTQLELWEQIVTSDVDLITQGLVAKNGKVTEDLFEENQQKALNIVLSNRAIINMLSNKLLHIKLVVDLADQQVLEEQSFFDKFIYAIEIAWDWQSEHFSVTFYYSLFDIGGVPITIAGIFKAIIIILVAVWISHFFGKAISRFGKRKGAKVEPNLYTFQRMIHYLIIIIGILLALASLGITMQNMAIVLGAIGVGVGFGLQNIVNNFLCGLVILFERSIKIGDIVELESGLFGKISEVNVQNSTIGTFDGVDVLVPNSSLIASNVINWTKKDPYQRLHIPFGVAYGTDQEMVSEVVCEAALQIPYTMNEKQGLSAPEVWLVEFGESSLNFELVVWVNIYKARGRRGMKAEFLSLIEKALKKNGIHIPYPQRDLHIKSHSSVNIGQQKNTQ